MAGIDNLAQAIAQAEGFNTAGTVPSRNNNPGDLTTAGTINAYSSPAEGMGALTNQLAAIQNGTSQVYTPSMTLSQMGTLWANGANDPQGAANWTSNVASYLGVDPSTSLATIMGGNGTGTATTAPATSSSSAGTGFFSGIIDWIEAHLEDGIFIVVGLLLLAAGLFAFKQTQTVIQTVGKHAGHLAEIAA